MPTATARRFSAKSADGVLHDLVVRVHSKPAIGRK
jgi:hypothetical protein